MATFGSIDPVRINPLFDLAKIDQAAQGYQRNALALEGAQRELADDTAFRELAPKVVSGDRDALGQAMGVKPRETTQLMAGMAAVQAPAAKERAASIEALQGMAGVLSTMPEDQQEGAYNTVRDLYGAQGIKLPPVYPGPAAARIMADLSLTPAQREERLKNTYSPAGNNAPGIGPSPDFALRMIGVESGGDPNARNPRSTATGAGQFIDGTWLDLLPKVKPELAAGKTPEQLLALRNDPTLAREMVDAYARRNGTTLASAGLPVNDATLAMAHRFGPDGAKKLLSANPATPIATLLPEVIGANPDLNGKTVADTLGFYERRVGGGGGVQIAARAAPAGVASDAANPLLQLAGGAGVAPPPASAGAAALPDRNARGEYDARGAPAGQGWSTASGQRVLVPLPGARDPDVKTTIDPKSGRVTRYNERTGAVERIGGEAEESDGVPRFSGNDAKLQAGNLIRTLGPKIEAGTATPEEIEAFRQSDDIYTRDTPDALTGRSVPGLPRTPGQQRALERLAEAGAPNGAPPNAGVDVNNPLAQPSRTETLPSGSTRTITPPQTTPQALEAARKIETEAGRVKDAIKLFKEKLGPDERTWGEAFNAAINNPTDPKATALNAAFSSLVTSMRGEAFLNTGVLQPGEIGIIDKLLINPQSLRGVLASKEGYEGLFGTLNQFIDDGVARQRAAAGLPANKRDLPATDSKPDKPADVSPTASADERKAARVAAVAKARAELGDGASQDAIIKRAQELVGR